LRLLRIYGTTARILAGYLWLRLWRPFVSADRYTAWLERRHRTSARQLHGAILAVGGLFIKVGQLISILANFLPPEFRNELAGLQDRLPPRPYDDIASRIRDELGADPSQLFLEFDRAPLATASLAQVHAATLGNGRRVAVKVQHRDIERTARRDLVVIRRILRIVQVFTGVRGLESYHPEISRMIGEELDFTAEARHIHEAGATFADDPAVRVPVVVHERSSARVLTTELIVGDKITDFAALAARGLDRRTLAARVVGAYCRMIFVTGVYHADPHPGNILVADDGAIAFVDFGAVGRLAPHMRDGIRAFFEGVIRRNPAQITESIRAMGFVARDPSSGDVALRVINYFQRKLLDQIGSDSWGLGDLQVDMRSRLETLADLRKLDVSFRQLTATFQVPTDWVLLERTLLLLLGLCTELDPSWNPMTVIRPYLEDVVLGEDRDWMAPARDALKETARAALTLPADVQTTLARLNRGEVEVRVPEITAAARMIYAGAQQLIFCIIGTTAGVIAYQAYDRGRERTAIVLGVVSVAAILTLVTSMRRATRAG
jgi:predicted unusual protein kinase regulating ubiquinone biosynthesis (AarF/ABC1/UbiB family)